MPSTSVPSVQDDLFQIEDGALVLHTGLSAEVLDIQLIGEVQFHRTLHRSQIIANQCHLQQIMSQVLHLKEHKVTNLRVLQSHYAGGFVHVSQAATYDYVYIMKVSRMQEHVTEVPMLCCLAANMFSCFWMKSSQHSFLVCNVSVVRKQGVMRLKYFVTLCSN